jgi:transposase
MQTVPQFFMGMDVSKHWVDLVLMKVVDHQKQPLLSARFDNTRAGMLALHGWLQDQGVSFDEHSLLVVENTGVYHRRIWQYCTEAGLRLVIGNAAAIKWSLGLTRGKSDQIDSRRLCAYAYKNREELQPTPLHSPELLQLKDLLRARSRLKQQAASTKVYLCELRHSSSAATHQLLEEAHQAALTGMKASMKAVEEQIKAILAANASLQTNYRLLLSVPGVGHLTAVYLLCCTSNFALRPSGKQLACYAGVVPFGHSSGTSIRGRDRVHPMANKELKRLLHLGALSAIKNHPEFKDYYERKTGEGKHALSVLNAVRNKLALRAAAVIIKQKPYTSNYTQPTPCS